MKKKSTDIGLQFIIPDEKQRRQWDSLVSNSPNGNIYSFSWYLDVVADGKWGIVVNADFSAGLPIAFKKRTGYKNVYQPFYTMFFDVVGRDTKVRAYVDAIANDYHHIHITTQSNSANIPHTQRVRQEMKLEKGFEKNYSENTKRQIKKAEKNGLQFGLHENAAEVVRLFKDNKGRELKEYKAADFTRLKNLIEEALKHKSGFCAHVTNEKTVLASAIFLTFNNRTIFLKGGVNDEGKEKGAMYYLMHKAVAYSLEKPNPEIQTQDTRHKTEPVFDFGGSNNKNVAEFYRKFGGNDVHYFEVELDRRNLVQKVISRLK
ncbi:MAG TPA: GNAT family N-acetyltransferase [Flavobacteriales bacterium]|nr:GNAT family N-acetyltransferase [Flavobacteriales bacterium]